ncbi:MAG: hypothetical protein WDN46_05735 [Methylocella sp.]
MRDLRERPREIIAATLVPEGERRKLIVEESRSPADRSGFAMRNPIEFAESAIHFERYLPGELYYGNRIDCD